MFRTTYSLDEGKTWQVACEDHENFWQASRDARDRTAADKKRVERIENIKLGKVLVAFTNGHPDTKYYNPHFMKQ